MIDVVRGKAGIIPETKAPEVYGRRGIEHGAGGDGGAQVEQARHSGGRSKDAGRHPVVQRGEPESRCDNDHGCKLPLVYLIGAADTTADRLKAVKEFADGIAPNKADVLARPEMVKDAHDLGMSVTVWTFRSGKNGKFQNVRDEMRYFLRELNVDALFTDNPDQFPRD